MGMSGARTLVAGSAEGAPIRLGEALSFWGGFDSATGRIIDRFHPQHGECLSGRILFVERGRGSSSGASVLAEALRLGTAPCGICLLNDDAIIATGALVAAMLYQIACPVVVLDARERWEELAARPHVAIEASEAGGVRFL
jgi:predicted aconitase with swiveling domain